MEANQGKLSPSRKYVLRKIVDESLLVPVSPQLKERNCLYVLNETSRRIYEGLASGGSPKELAKSFATEFNITEEAALADIQECLSMLCEIEALDEFSGS